MAAAQAGLMVFDGQIQHGLAPLLGRLTRSQPPPLGQLGASAADSNSSQR